MDTKPSRGRFGSQSHPGSWEGFQECGVAFTLPIRVKVEITSLLIESGASDSPAPEYKGQTIEPAEY